MRASFIVRFLGIDDELLAWTRVTAVARPPVERISCPFFAEPGESIFLVERDGHVKKVSVHWADLNVARVRDMDEMVKVAAGQLMKWTWIEPVWMVAGMPDVPLPPVIEREPIVVGVPTGVTGIVAHA